MKCDVIAAGIVNAAKGVCYPFSLVLGCAAHPSLMSMHHGTFCCVLLCCPLHIPCNHSLKRCSLR